MQRENNFDLLRLCFAWMVVLFHCYGLSLAPQLYWIKRFDSATAAVEGFFAISGCLIVASWDRSRTLAGYFRRRAERILPAYWLAFLYSIVVGAVMTTLPLGAFLRSHATWKYIVGNLSFANFLQPGLPGVFAGNDTDAVNGALWTLKIEVGFYLFVPVLVWVCRRLGAGWTLAGVFVLSCVYRAALNARGHSHQAGQLPGQLAYFAVGAAVYFCLPWFQRHRQMMWALAITSAAAGVLTDWFPLRAFGIPLLVMCAGFLLPAYRGITRYGDFSYGAYVLHYPTIQVLVSLGLFARWPHLSVLFIVVSVTLLSVASWFGVESRFLRRQRVRQQESDVAAAVA